MLILICMYFVLSKLFQHHTCGLCQHACTVYLCEWHILFFKHIPQQYFSGGNDIFLRVNLKEQLHKVLFLHTKWSPARMMIMMFQAWLQLEFHRTHTRYNEHCHWTVLYREFSNVSSMNYCYFVIDLSYFRSRQSVVHGHNNLSSLKFQRSEHIHVYVTNQFATAGVKAVRPVSKPSGQFQSRSCQRTYMLVRSLA